MTTAVAWETAAFTAVSYLTDPICKAHELWRRVSLVDSLNPDSWKVTKLAYKGCSYFQAVSWMSFDLALIFCFTCIPLPSSVAAIGLRFLASNLQRKPFIHWTGRAEPLTAKPSSFSLLSWNICCVGAGYAISDGGVMPWPFRIDLLASKILEQKADVVCLSEVFDIKTASALYDAMKDDYAHFYVHIGPRTVGVSSGLFIASKYELNNPNFTAFPKEMLMGRTKNSEKGVFSFDVANFATVFTTHLQNSEEPQFPTTEEQTARRQEMELVMEKVKRVAAGRAVIVTGDLNLDPKEFKESAWSHEFQSTDNLPPTWGGDEFCAKLAGRKRFSTERTLDYTLLKNGTAQEIKTTVVETAYNASKFKRLALSDHLGLRSVIQL
jgi:exonuclease III